MKIRRVFIVLASVVLLACFVPAFALAVPGANCEQVGLEPAALGIQADEEAYAILYEDGTLVFQRGESPKDTETHGAVTGSWTDFEGDEWTDRGDEGDKKWRSSSDSIVKAVFRDSISPQDLSRFFADCEELVSIEGIEKLSTNNSTSMAWMFSGCRKLEILDVSGFDTSSVTSMGGMFASCLKLEALDVSGFDTSNVTSMREIFWGCSSLTALDISGFDTSNVTNMYGMFGYCTVLEALDFSSFDTSNVTSMGDMLRGCRALVSLDLSSFDTSMTDNVKQMFFDCDSLASLDISSFDTSNMTYKSGFLSADPSLSWIKLGPKTKLDSDSVLPEGPWSLAGGSTTLSAAELVAASASDSGAAGVWTRAVETNDSSNGVNGDSDGGSNAEGQAAGSSSNASSGHDGQGDGGVSGGAAATTAQDGGSGFVMHRLYNEWSGEHFYTADDAEFAGLVDAGWADEGAGWTAPESSDTPVFRLYNPYAGEHHYTMDSAERDSMVEAGWNDEGIGWYSDDAQAVPLYREYNPYAFANNHNYTTDPAEHDYLVSIGWLDEGYAWYGV